MKPNSTYLPRGARRFFAVALTGLATLTASAQTLDECQQAAEANYPLIRRYQLVQSTTDVSLDNINKGWLPQVSAYAQGTVQNKVVALPDALTSVMAQQGQVFGGLKKEQYKIGVDVSQTIYDGGRMRQQKEVVRRQGDVESAQLETSLYGVRQRVNDLYFGVLLVNEKLQLNQDLQTLLQSSEQKVQSMVKAGTAATSDLASLQAERMNARQQAVELQSQKTALLRVLSLFVGKEVAEVSRPSLLSDGSDRSDKSDQSDWSDQSEKSAFSSFDATLRPEYTLFNKQIALLDAQEKALDTRLRPTLSAFAQGYYGYTGFDMFHDMQSATPSFNGLFGVRLAWNIGALYTRKNDKSQLNIQRQQAQNQLDVFLFNNRLETTQQDENIAKYRKLKAQDDEIIALRASVRKAAESKLAHGIIDVNDLVKEINNENSAKIQQTTHDIEMLKAVYDLRYSLNR
ncbi:MAG: TolC family protein [Prevotella sp.]|nr:TolC family protein [Prevotella sp.]